MAGRPSRLAKLVAQQKISDVTAWEFSPQKPSAARRRVSRKTRELSVSDEPSALELLVKSEEAAAGVEAVKLEEPRGGGWPRKAKAPVGVQEKAWSSPTPLMSLLQVEGGGASVAAVPNGTVVAWEPSEVPRPPAAAPAAKAVVPARAPPVAPADAIVPAEALAAVDAMVPGEALAAVEAPSTAADVIVAAEADIPAAALIPWRIDMNRGRPPPRQPVPSLACWRPQESNWQGEEPKPEEDCAYRRWVRRAEACAVQHVEQAFENLERHIHAIELERPDGDLCCVLALAGPDGADHDAAMQQAEHLVRERLQEVQAAVVAPEDLQSNLLAIRRTCAQLMCRPTHWEEEEDGEDAGDTVPVPAGAGLMDYLDWRSQQGATGPALLLVERADAAPKTVLREFLGCWGAACRDGCVPSLVVLGLLQPPQSRFSLLEGEPTVPLRIMDAFNLFDARTVCSQMLEHLMLDKACPVPLPPEIFSWLWDLFIHCRRSVHHVKRALALLCEHLKEGCPLAAFAGLAQDLEACDGKAGHVREIKRMMQEQLKRADWPQGAVGEANVTEVCEELRGWHARTSVSLKSLDYLLKAADPLTAHQPSVRRLGRFLQPFFPVDEEMGEEEQKGLGNDLLERCLGSLQMQNPHRLPLKVLKELLKDVLALGTGYHSSQYNKAFKHIQKLADFAAEKDTEKGQVEEEKALRKGLDHIFRSIWCTSRKRPLAGDEKALFTGRLLPCARALPPHVGAALVQAPVAETLLLPLAGARGGMADASVLFRLMESSAGKAISVRELWRAFATYLEKFEAAPPGCEKAQQERFGQGLVTLQFMGLLSAQNGAAADRFEGARGWRLRRRLFGRAWMRRSLPQEKQALPLARQEASASERQELVPLPAPEEPQKPKLAPWCMWVGARGALRVMASEPGESRKRPLPPQPQQGGKRGKRIVKQRVRMFMG